MRARIILDESECVLEATKLLLWYFGESEERRAIPARALRRASRLLKLMARWEGGKTITWRRSGQWKERLELAGLDPETCEVVDHGRWDMTWEQLSRRRTFRDDVQRRWIREGYVAERAGSYIRAVQLPEKKERPVDERVEGYVAREIRRRVK